MKLPDFIVTLIEEGIQVTICFDKKWGVYYNLNLESKSHLYVYQKDGQWFADMRYNTTLPINDVENIYSAAKAGMHGRDFINADWERVLIKHGHLTVTEVVTVTKTYS